MSNAVIIDAVGDTNVVFSVHCQQQANAFRCEKVHCH